MRACNLSSALCVLTISVCSSRIYITRVYIVSVRSVWISDWEDTEKVNFRDLELYRFPFYVNYECLDNFYKFYNTQIAHSNTAIKKSIKDRILLYPMNGEYEMCFCGHFRKDHAHGSGVTVSNCGCGCLEFRKRN